MKRNALHSLFTLGTALLVTAFAPACSSDDNDAAPGNGSSDGPTEKPIHTLVVAADGSGDYTTLQEAFDALPVDGEPHIVRLRPGTYCEKVTLTADHPRVTLIGDDAEKCIITYDDYAGHPTETGNGTLGTWRSQTLLIEADDFTACGVTIANTYVNSQANAAVNKDTQAVALRVEGDRVTLYECRVMGYQDTLFGRGTGRVYLRDCHVEGNVDFIFGSSTIVVDHCTLHMNRNNSVVTAPRPRPTTGTASFAWTARSASRRRTRWTSTARNSPASIWAGVGIRRKRRSRAQSSSAARSLRH